MTEESLIVPTEDLRDKIRRYSRKIRDEKRNVETDSLRFGLGEITCEISELENLTQKDVQGLANRMKRRKRATAEDMYRLSHAFLQDIENIRAFSKIPGAIQTLVKELTGSDAEQKFHAIETLCNLSLGEEPVCDKIAAMAGSYLITYLDTTDERLKRHSLWTLMNIMATGGKGAETMMSMELVPKLLNLYLAGDEEEFDYREDAAILLDIITSSEEKLLRASDLNVLLEKMFLKNHTAAGAEYHLKIIFDAGIVSPGILLSEAQANYLVIFSLANLTQTPDFEGISNRMRILYAIRLLSNLLALNTGCFNVLTDKCLLWDTNLVRTLNRIFAFKNESLGSETLWLVKNIAACHADGSLVSDFIQHLHVYSKSLPPHEDFI